MCPNPHLVLLLFCLLLLSVFASAVNSSDCDPCVAGGCYGYDFRALPELHVSGPLGVYSFAFCAETSECGSAFAAGQVCLYSGGQFLSLGLHSTAVWQLLEPSQPAAGLQLSIGRGDDWLLLCYDARSNITVSCGNGDSALTLVQEGRTHSCSWSFQVQGNAVCQQLSSSSSSSSSSSTAGESSTGGGGGGGGGDGCLVPVLLAIIVTLTVCFLIAELSHGPGSL